MARLYVADKETLDAVKADTTGILKQLQDADGKLYARLQAELESPATKMIMQSMSSIEMNVAMMQEMMEV